jgi:hypothetical protein
MQNSFCYSIRIDKKIGDNVFSGTVNTGDDDAFEMWGEK